METTTIILENSNPLPDKTKKIKKLYWVALVLMVAGVIIPACFAIGVLALLFIYPIDNLLVNISRKNLRTLKFKFDTSIALETLFEYLQSALISKYGDKMILEKLNDKITVTFDSHIYDISINEDGTFSIWWRKSITKALFSFSEYKSYKKLLAAYGIIGYEVQNIPNKLTKGE